MNHFFICGGGTGGHFFSGLAVAELLLERYPDSRIHLIGTRYGIEARTRLEDSRMQVHFIASRGIKGKGIFSKIFALAMMGYGFFQSVGLLLHFKPKFVLGVGGYASAPTLLAATLIRFLGPWRLMVLDQNSSPGLVNRFFSKINLEAYCAFDWPGFQVVDLPLRAKFRQQIGKQRHFSWPPKTILVMGGSQGATGLNKKWIEILPRLRMALPSLDFIHQTGRADEDWVKKAYRDADARAEVFAFSNEMPKYYEQADLIICRSGALSLFEVMAFQRPCIFVPFPKAADDHQTKNALAVQNSKWVIAESELSWERLKPLLMNPEPAVPKRPKTPDKDWNSLLADL